MAFAYCADTAGKPDPVFRYIYDENVSASEYLETLILN